MVQPCPECRQTRQHKMSCKVPVRARWGYGYTTDPLAAGFDAPDTGTTYTSGGCDTTDTRTADTTTNDPCTPGGGE